MVFINLLYHLAFLVLFILQEMDMSTDPRALGAIKFIGFTIIFLIFVGGLIEILDFLIPVVTSICCETRNLALFAYQKLTEEKNMEEEG